MKYSAAHIQHIRLRERRLIPYDEIRNKTPQKQRMNRKWTHNVCMCVDGRINASGRCFFFILFFIFILRIRTKHIQNRIKCILYIYIYIFIHRYNEKQLWILCEHWSPFNFVPVSFALSCSFYSIDPCCSLLSVRSIALTHCVNALRARYSSFSQMKHNMSRHTMILYGSWLLCAI